MLSFAGHRVVIDALLLCARFTFGRIHEAWSRTLKTRDNKKQDVDRSPDGDPVLIRRCKMFNKSVYPALKQSCAATAVGSAEFRDLLRT